MLKSDTLYSGLEICPLHDFMKFIRSLRDRQWTLRPGFTVSDFGDFQHIQKRDGA